MDNIQIMELSLKSIAKKAALLEVGNITGLEEVADVLSGIIVENKNELSSKYIMVSEKIQDYIEQLLTGGAEETWPLEEGILLLRAIERSMRTESDFVFELREIVNLLEGDEELLSTNEVRSSLASEISIDEPKDQACEIKEKIELLIKRGMKISTDDIMAFGEILNSLEFIEKQAKGEEYRDFTTISISVRKYIEKLILAEETETEILEESFVLMQAMFKSIQKGEEFSFGMEGIVEKLGGFEKTPTQAEIVPVAAEVRTVNSKPVKDLDDEDLEILNDFIIESRDNLESIEIHLIDLEQTPGDNEIINAIFRPFHTIKGVSGFLDLRKINSLAHSTENLLDSARKGEFEIDNEITDVILQSVDVLKNLIDMVEKGLELGKSADDSDIKIEPLVQRIENINAGVKGTDVQDNKMPVGEILIEKGKLQNEELSKALGLQKKNPDKRLGEILIEENIVESKEVISALRDQKRTRKVSTPQVKVDTNKLDNLVDLTGELVIAQSMLRENTIALSSGDQKLNQNLNQLGQIVSNIQKIAMSMRMVPIKATFQKMVRLVRDLAKNCKKDVSLEMSGEDTEIDRNVVEALYEPMVHMIRNSIDHGLESSEERVASEKESKGTIRLQAYHKAGNIVIEIIDDGRGLNKMNILEKAVSSGLIESDAVLSDQEIFQLIMKPGFSTAKEITDISGRGVGMDVVKKAIESLNGRVDIHSVEGEGSTVTISLPLTLAIIEGMLVRVGQERFIVPTMAILESFKPVKKDYYTVEGKGEMIMFRNSLIPIVRLNRICGVEMDNNNVWDNIVIVVENKKEQRGILIDELLGKEEFVIKSLGETLKGIKGLAGGAIMSDGRVGLILDIGGLFEVSFSY